MKIFALDKSALLDAGLVPWKVVLVALGLAVSLSRPPASLQTIEGAPGFVIDAGYLPELQMAWLPFENWESLSATPRLL